MIGSPAVSFESESYLSVATPKSIAKSVVTSRSRSNFGTTRQVRFHSSNPCIVSGGLDPPNTICMPVAVRDGIEKVYIATVLGASRGVRIRSSSTFFLTVTSEYNRIPLY